MSAIGEGTWYFERSERTSALAALKKGLDVGINHVDTAEVYGNGEAEKMIGESVGEYRGKVFLVSKVFPEHASRKGTIEACKHSLSRLKTDHLDCYLLHWRGSLPLEETIEAFEGLKSDGKILSWGVSNFGVSDLEEVERIAGKGKLACDQVLYHLKDRSVEDNVIPWCEKHGVSVTAYSPYGHGNFPSPRTREGQVLEEIATVHNATPRQVALSFLIRNPVVFAIPKGSKPEHVAENDAGADVHLTDDEISQIDENFPIGPSPGFPPWS